MGELARSRFRMLRQEREAEILRLLAGADGGARRVAELSQALGVSQMTIRRDLEELERRGLVRRVHGGAMQVNGALLFERSFSERGQEAFREKVAIGRAAAALVRDGAVCILDAGTTTLQVARHISARNVIAVTNALPVAMELAAHEGISAILLGGNLKGRELCTVGPMVTDALAKMTADVLFLSTMGVSLERGLTEADIREAEVKRWMIAAARKVVLVADSSKFGAAFFVQTVPLEKVDVFICDSGLPEPARHALSALGIELVIASPEGAEQPRSGSN